MLLEKMPTFQTVQYAMGTVMSHKAYGMLAEDCLAVVSHEIEWLENHLSRFLPDSEISRINQIAGSNCVKVSEEVFDVLLKAVDFSVVCPMSFDITIGPLVDLWKIGKGLFTRPAEDLIQQALELVDYRDLVLDPVNMTAGLKKAGQAIDLGAIGKGLAGDKIMDIYKTFGVGSAYSNLGGNVVTLGTKPDGSPWYVGIQHPRRENQLLGSVAVINRSVVTSGDYQRFTSDQDGNKYHHILSPVTGYPTESALTSVTIVSASSTTADALSTALFVAGIEKGFELLKSFPETEAILMNAEEQVFVTQGLSDFFQPEQGIRVNFVNRREF